MDRHFLLKHLWPNFFVYCGGTKTVIASEGRIKDVARVNCHLEDEH